MQPFRTAALGASAFAALLALSVAGCRSPWPSENVAGFEKACLANARQARPSATEDALRAYCRCAANAVQARFSLEEFTALEAAAVRENKPAVELLRVVEECGQALR